MNARFLRYYVRTLPDGKPVKCPVEKSMLMDLYFSTIMKLTGLDESAARRKLESGKCIRTRECEFWARSPFDEVIIMHPPKPERIV
jgi:hypothetical protein